MTLFNRWMFHLWMSFKMMSAPR